MSLDHLTVPEVRKCSNYGRDMSEGHWSWFEKAPTGEI